MAKHIAVYLRVSTGNQKLESQLPDLERWVAQQDGDVKWYRDKWTGKTMDRPAFNKLLADIQSGKVSVVCVWRLDRLGRTASGMTKLFEDFRERRVNLVSLRDSLDLSTPAGRLMANVLASVAAYETEIRAERVKAGQAVARAKGKQWGGSKKGQRSKVSAEQIRVICSEKERGTPIARIAKLCGLSRPTVYSVLDTQGKGESAI